MNSLSSCGACQCFVKSEDSTCPFCGAEMNVRALKRLAPRMSRAAWLALGSSAAAWAGVAALAACSSTSAAPPASGKVDASDSGDGGGDAEGDALTDALVDAGPTFSCGSGDAQSGCPVADGVCITVPPCDYPGPPGGTAWCDGNPYTESCVGRPNCECVVPYLVKLGHSDAWYCTDIDGGGVTLVNNLPCQAGCYGSPPARLERLVTI